MFSYPQKLYHKNRELWVEKNKDSYEGCTTIRVYVEEGYGPSIRATNIRMLCEYYKQVCCCDRVLSWLNSVLWVKGKLLLPTQWWLQGSDQ